MTTSTPTKTSIGGESCNAITKGPYRNMWGTWESHTRVSLGDSRFLSLTTMKTSGGMATVARVEKDQGNGFSVWEMFGDFSQRVGHGDVRCTEKTVRDIHGCMLKVMPDLLKEAQAFYAAKAQKVAA